MKKLDIFKLCMEISNSSSFFIFLLSQNYITKSTSSLFIFSTIFIPTAIYSFFKLTFSHKFRDFGFQEIFYGMFLGSLDFLFYYMLFLYMLNNSTFLVLFLIGVPCLLLFFPILLPNLVCNGIFTYLMFCLLSTVSEFELYGMNRNHDIMLNLYTGLNDQYKFLLIVYLIRTLFYAFAVKETKYNNLQTSNIFFLSFFSCIYVFIDSQLRINEAKLFSKRMYIPIISLFIYICTHRFYSSSIFFICFGICCTGYFVAPNFWIFLVNRTESALYLVYLSLFIIIVLLYIYESTFKLNLTEVVINNGVSVNIIGINSFVESDDEEEEEHIETREMLPYSSV